MPDSSAWAQYRWRARLDAFLASAEAILYALDDEKSAADLEMLRKQNVSQMSQLQGSAYDYYTAAFGNSR